MRLPVVVQLLVAAVAGLVLGGLTLVAQGVLNDWAAPLANSPSGWTLVIVVVVLLVRPRPAVGAVCGLIAFVALVLGYTVAAELSGLGYDPLVWLVVGVIAGPFVGAAAAVLPDPRPRPRAAGTALLAAVALTDCVYGLTVVAASTDPTYWIVIGVIGAALLLVVGTRLGSVRLVAEVIGLTVALVVVGTLGYRFLNAVVPFG